jgi:predicted phosphate transport protein (TIGR00153 family)
MKLDAVLHAFLPKDKTFLSYFEKDVDNLLSAATVFREMMRGSVSTEERAQKIRKIEELEHKGDEVTHLIYSELSSTFITPFDREDIHALASKLDDILDYLQGASTRIVLYRVESITPEMERLAAMIYEAVAELHKVIPQLHDLGNAVRIRDSLVKINSIENEADDLFERA